MKLIILCNYCHIYYPARPGSWIVNHGVPERVLSDQGANLDPSSVMKELYSVLQIKKSRTTAYKPSTNGLAENKYTFESPSNIREELRDSDNYNNDLLLLKSAAEDTFLKHQMEIEDKIKLTSQYRPAENNRNHISLEYMILINISVSLVCRWCRTSSE